MEGQLRVLSSRLPPAVTAADTPSNPPTSLCQPEKLEFAREILREYEQYDRVDTWILLAGLVGIAVCPVWAGYRLYSEEGWDGKALGVSIVIGKVIVGEACLLGAVFYRDLHDHIAEVSLTHYRRELMKREKITFESFWSGLGMHGSPKIAEINTQVERHREAVKSMVQAMKQEVSALPVTNGRERKEAVIKSHAMKIWEHLYEKEKAS